MIQTGDVHKCCGCYACVSICGHDAIKMNIDSMGFAYPEVNVEKCVECGLCEKICMFQYDDVLDPKLPSSAYAVRHKDLREIETSRSGAVFIALSDWILDKEGAIYGAGYGEHFSIRHKRAVDACNRNEFKGSKYAQSNMSGVYQKLKVDLKEGKIVLFSGTPCQTATVKAFVPKVLQENLYLIDIICHGVSSPTVWNDYLLYLEEKVGQTLIAVDFRDKAKYGWSGLHKESFVFEDGKKRTFQYTYYNDLLIRPSCNVCPYANLNRPSDITIGDFWGWEKACPSFNKDDKGCSLVLINSSRGKDWFDSVTDQLHFVEVPLQLCIQPNLQQPTPENPLRTQFESDYRRKGFKYVMRRYGEVGIKYHYRRVLHFIKRHIKRLIK